MSQPTRCLNRVPRPHLSRAVTSDPEPFSKFLREVAVKRSIKLFRPKTFRTMEQNVEKDKREYTLIQDDWELKCKEYLVSLFGESTAEYFLSPYSRSKDVPQWFSQLQDDMKDHMSAEALWDALGQRCTQILQESNTDSSMIARRVVDWKTLKKQEHLKHLALVRYMFRTAQRNRAITALLLQRNPRFNNELNDEPSCPEKSKLH